MAPFPPPILRKPPVVQTPSPQPTPTPTPTPVPLPAPPPTPVPVPPTPPVPTVPAHYQVIDLPPLPGDIAAQAQAIANDGHVVGWSISNGISKATLWENGTVENLGLGVAYALNSIDEAVGYTSQGNGIVHATLWDHGTTSDLLTLSGMDSSIATGINDSGTIVGVSFSSQNPATQSGFKWTQATGIQAIDGVATATSVNSAGDISGMTSDSQAAIFTAEGTTIKLGTLGDFSLAISVNDSRHAVGYSPLQNGGPVHAFFYNGNMLDLGTIQSGSNTLATSVNNDDLVVGTSNLNGTAKAWIWSATTGIEDLNSLIPTDSGWVLTVASSVDQNGNVVGAGVFAGETHGYILTPD